MPADPVAVVDEGTIAILDRPIPVSTQPQHHGGGIIDDVHTGLKRGHEQLRVLLRINSGEMRRDLADDLGQLHKDRLDSSI